MPKIGAHVSAAVSLELAFTKAQNIGAECFQFFVSPPQQWAFTHHDTAEIERFQNKAQETQIGPNFIHGTYLVNLGTSKTEHLQKSIDWLTYGMHMASKLGLEGVIFHTGSHKGAGFQEVLPQVVKALKEVLEKTEGKEGQEGLEGNSANGAAGSLPRGTRDTRGTRSPFLILETSAGGGGSIGRDFHELGEILRAVREIGELGWRVKVCIDTQHTFAAGYDWRTNIDAILEEFDREVGLENLVAFHANDSKMEFGSNRDRHENIGDGFIGREGFEQIINHPKLKNVPLLLEVPGFADEGPDKENVDILKQLRKS